MNYSMTYEEYLDFVREQVRKNGVDSLAAKVCRECNREFRRNDNPSLRIPVKYDGSCPRCGRRLELSSCSF